jgi:alkaline phosphatase
MSLWGGVSPLLPQSTASSRCKDWRDLFKEFETKGYHVVTTRTELRATSAPDKLPTLHLGT